MCDLSLIIRRKVCNLESANLPNEWDTTDYYYYYLIECSLFEDYRSYFSTRSISALLLYLPCVFFPLAAPRFRNSIAVSTLDSIRKRPHSVISVSSNSSSSGGSSSSNGGGGNKQTGTSHCSSAESGIVTDWNTNTMSTNSSVVSDSNNSPSHQLSVKL